jgi:hypothetical protein
MKQAAGMDVSNPYNMMRLKYAQNAIAFAALQEGILDLARITGMKAEDILDRVVKGKLPDSDKVFLTTLQKTMYLQMQMFRGRIDDPDRNIGLHSITGDLEDPDTELDWSLLRQAAVTFKSSLINGAYSQDAFTLDIAPDHVRGIPVVILDQDAPSVLVEKTLERIGIAKPDAILMFSGGAALMDEKTDLEGFKRDCIRQVQDQIRANRRVLIVSGGTGQGLNSVVNEAMQELFAKDPIMANSFVQVLGIAPADKATFDPKQVGTKSYGAPYMVGDAQTHVILIDTTESGGTADGTETTKNVLSLCGKDAVTGAVVANGGEGTAYEVRMLIDLGYPIMVLAESGRLASLIEVALRSSSLQEFKDNVAHSSYDEKTKSELKNIFYILRLDDPDVETETIGEGREVPAQTEENYRILRDILSHGQIQLSSSSRQ